MIPEARMQLYQRAVEVWGQEAQVHQSIEEMAELTVVLSHATRQTAPRKVTTAEIIEELADVRLMIEQVMFIFGLSEEDVSEVEELKLKRLKEILDGLQGPRSVRLPRFRLDSGLD